VFNGLAPSKRSLIATVEELRPAVVIVDSLSRFLGLRNEDDAALMTRELKTLLRIRDLGTSVIAIHHARKRDGTSGKNMRGSSALHAATDLTIEVHRTGTN
jgi:RecA-family ATPase